MRVVVQKIHWNCHNRCNLSCRFCYLWRMPKSQPLDTASAGALVYEASHLTAWFVFGGGDPLMRPDIQPLVKLASDSGLKVDLQTNAELLTPEMASGILPYLSRLGLSLDGPEEVHDQIREKKGNFQAVLRALDLAERYGVKTTIRTMVCAENLGCMRELAPVISSKSVVQKWSLRQFAPLGRGAKHRSRFDLSERSFKAEVRKALSPEVRPSLQVNAVSGEDMKKCYCLVSENGFVYGHTGPTGYRAAGKFPERSLAEIVHALPYDGQKRARRDLCDLNV